MPREARAWDLRRSSGRREIFYCSGGGGLAGAWSVDPARPEIDVIRGITHLSFDADGTLWDFETVMREGLRRAAAAIVARHPEAKGLDGERLRAVRDAVAAELPPPHDHARIRRRGFARALEEIGCPDDAFAARLSREYLAFRLTAIRVFPEVEPTLRQLARHFTLGLVSNGNTDPVRAPPGVAFGFQVFAASCGVAKPDPGIFAAALRAAGCPAERMLHVGDSLADDVACPQALGIRAVWLDRRGDGDTAGAVPDLVVRSLGELLDHLELPGGG
ncbi:MAG TPA: HAD family hydrolase [Thermoanaerobaculia bacterium]|nr:HAD family hydrolase [Thermoanaerobaculia bacterium]